MQIFVNKNGQQLGPYTIEQLQQYLAMGSGGRGSGMA